MNGETVGRVLCCNLVFITRCPRQEVESSFQWVSENVHLGLVCTFLLNVTQSQSLHNKTSVLKPSLP